MALDTLYTVDGISSSRGLSHKQFMISISCKMELRWINSSPLLSQGIGMIYFGGSFVCLSHFLYIFAKKRLLWDQAIFSNFSSVNFETGVLIISVFLS